MSEAQLRDLATHYVDKQIKNVDASVSAEKREELIQSAVVSLNPRLDPDYALT